MTGCRDEATSELSRVAAAVFQPPALEPVRVILEEDVSASKFDFPSWDRRGSLLSGAKQAGWYYRNASAASLLIFPRSAPYTKIRMRCRAALMEARCARVSEVPPRSPRASARCPSYPRRGDFAGRHIFLGITQTGSLAGGTRLPKTQRTP
jgi:hypothetical protein